MTEWGLRIKAVASKYFVLLVAVAILVTLAGGWLVYSTHIDPGEERQLEVQNSWQSTAEYRHQATVTEENQVFPVGTTLEDQSTYYTRIAPELNSTFTYGFQATDGQLDVDASSELVIRSVNENDEVMWRVTEPLGNDSTTLTPGESLAVDFTINVSEVNADIDAIESDLGASAGDTEVFVQTDVTATGTAAGEPAEHEEAYNLALSPSSDTYGVSAEDGTETHENTEPVTREVEYGLLRSALGPLLLLLGLVSLVGLGIIRQQGLLDVSDADRTAMILAAERDEFDDWISQGSVSPAATDRPTIDIDSLEELVDVAIDTDSRVIEDAETGHYYVLTDANCYRYEPPRTTIE